ncbi:MAG: putative box helicase domain protein [Candidatus Saccharibacteria bacterium]|nr:putative box helicase domain protein [Candidatus Saccharibacteria bacterium]
MPSYKYSVYSSAKRSGSRNGGGQRNGGGGRSGGKRRGEYIDPARLVRVAKPVEETKYESVNTFQDFVIEPTILNNLLAKGYTIPSAIQDQTIPIALEGADIIGIANTGTGKTAAFAVPVLHRLMNEPKSKVLIIAPTRELAQQIEEECRSIAKGSGLTGALLIGGTGMVSQLRDLRFNPRIIIGTPGRIKDHMERGTLKVGDVNMVVLDEVDRMLDMGFVNDVTDLLKQLAPERQSFFFSATMDGRVEGLIRTFANDPKTVAVKSGETSDNVHQDVVRFSGTGDKMAKLHDILLDPAVNKVIVFDETQRSVERLGMELQARGFEADTIHGGKSQGQRLRALDRFKQNKTTILVATDVAARGIDVADVTHVVNYTMPQSYQDYVHRIGRVGRAGKIGHALTFVGN